jgi:LAT3 family solute carrier family 43 protein 3
MYDTCSGIRSAVVVQPKSKRDQRCCCLCHSPQQSGRRLLIIIAATRDEATVCPPTKSQKFQFKIDTQQSEKSRRSHTAAPITTQAIEACVAAAAGAGAGDASSVLPRMRHHNRWILFAFAFVSTSLVAGTVYGWPALRRQLQHQDGTTLSETQLGAIYTVGSWSAQGGRFFTGLARDKYGTRAVGCAALACCMAGSIGIAVAHPDNAIALGASLFVLSLGAGIQLVVQPVGSLFPTYSNSIISSLSGSFQISGLVFLGLTSLPGGVSRRQAFLGYAVVIAILGLLAWWLLPPSASFLPPPEPDSSSTTASTQPFNTDDIETPKKHSTEHQECKEEEEEEELGPTSHSDDNLQPENDPTCIVDVNDNDKEKEILETKLQQMVSLEYMALLIWFSTCLIPLQYYVGSIGFQLEDKGDEDGFYSDLFSIVFAAAAVMAPAGGYLSDRLGLGLTQAMATIMVALSFWILAATQIQLSAQAAGLVLYSVGRMLVFGMFFSNIGRRFGYHNFGTLSGVGLLLSAICSILQYPLIAAASQGSAAEVNVGAGAALMCLTPYCAWLSWTERRHTSARSLLQRRQHQPP